MTAAHSYPPKSWQRPSTHYVSLLRDPWYRQLLRLFDGFQYATSTFWRERGTLAAPLPITTGAISSPMGLGSDSSPVRVEIQGIQTYLADSQQFALELMCRLSGTGAYYVMPSFRGEANDERHLGQFLHSEAELPCDLAAVQRTVEDYLRALARFFLAEFSTEVADTAGSLLHIEQMANHTSPFPTVRFTEAIELLKAYPGAIRQEPTAAWRTISPVGERALLRNHGPFLWVTHYDELAVPFYQAVELEQASHRVARNADLLFGIGETVGAGERHASATELRESIARHRLSEAPYEWYIRMREEMPMITAGFGMGVERYLLWLLAQDDIRDMMILVRENGVAVLP